MLNMKNSEDLFSKNLDDAFKSIKLNQSTMDFGGKLKSKFKEDKNYEITDKEFEKLFKKEMGKKQSTTKITPEISKKLEKGIKVELEHTKNKQIARKIALDHLSEDPNYYDKLEKIESTEATGSGSAGAYVSPLFTSPESKKVEAKEATGSNSVGAYETPAAWAKSTGKKDWRGASKTQIPGGSFVTVKKKCTTFPYCNQGDIKSLKISKNKLKEAISNVSKKLNISEDQIRLILIDELRNTTI